MAEDRILKIAVDAGHGRYTSGKRCHKKLDPNQTREWVLNDRAADEFCKIMQGLGHICKRVDDPTGKRDVPLKERVRKANIWGADVYVSIHQNAGVNLGKGGGTEVYVYTHCQKKSKELQELVYKYAIKYGNLKGNRSDGTRSAEFYVLKYTKMPAFLIECGFMDSKTDIKSILDPAWSKQIARGIAEGVCEAFDVPKPTAKKAETKKSEFLVRAISDHLNVRKEPGLDTEVVDSITDHGTYTIVATKKADGLTWGELKSGAGYISLSAKYVERL